ncbi:MAG: methionine ABC transporter substrate-binding protein, partial [Marinobacter sp.]|nr:methionine ABC transporter substrate-binding protein [Marinobacter sp.]
MNLKKTLVALAAAAVTTFSVSASAEKLSVAATPVPHAEILEFIKPKLAK